jgi:PAS domain S-box-containing protein
VKHNNSPASTPPKSRLLLVDDKPENLIALEAVLSADYQLVSAQSGAEALELLKTNDVDVVLLDIQMPGMDGYETARRIKQMEHCKDLPIIFITAIYTEDPHIKKGYEAGALDYFTKPFDPDILKMKIAIYASFRQKESLLREREKRMRESEELLKAGRKLSAILETLTVGVIIADTEGRIIQTNDAVSRIWKSPDPLGDDAYGEFIKWWGREGQVIKEAFTRALSRGQATHNETIRIKCFDESSKEILGSVSPLTGLNDVLVGAVAVVQDITEHKKIEEDMEQRILKLISLGIEFEQTAH